MIDVYGKLARKALCGLCEEGQPICRCDCMSELHHHYQHGQARGQTACGGSWAERVMSVAKAIAEAVEAEAVEWRMDVEEREAEAYQKGVEVERKSCLAWLESIAQEYDDDDGPVGAAVIRDAARRIQEQE